MACVGRIFLDSLNGSGHKEITGWLFRTYGARPEYTGALNVDQMKLFSVTSKEDGEGEGRRGVLEVYPATGDHPEGRYRWAFEGLFYSLVWRALGGEVSDGKQPLLNTKIEGESPSGTEIPFYSGSQWITKLYMCWAYYLENHPPVNHDNYEEMQGLWNTFLGGYKIRSEEIIKGLFDYSYSNKIHSPKSHGEVRKALLGWDGIDKDNNFPKLFYELSIGELYDKLWPSAEEEQVLGGSSILRKNLPYINTLARDGKSAGHIALEIVKKEFWPSYVPIESLFYILAHKKKARPSLVVFSGVGLGVAAGFWTFVSLGFALSFIPVFGGIIIGLFSAAGANFASHCIIDFNYIKASGLVEAIKAINNADRDLLKDDENGNVRTEVLIAGELPEKSKDIVLTNTGIQVEEGKPIWAWANSEKHALVLFGENVNPEDIEERVKELLITKGPFEPSGMTEERMTELIKMTGIDQKFSGFEMGMVIDWTSKEDKITYREEDGMPVIPFTLLMEDEKFNPSLIKKKLDALKLSNIGERKAMDKTICMEFDDITSLADLRKMFQVSVLLGRNQGAIKPDILEKLKLSDEKIKDLLGLAKKAEFDLWIDLRSGNQEAEKYKALGFTKYIMNGEDGNPVIYNFYSEDKKGLKAREILNYGTVEKLKEEIKSSKSDCNLVKMSGIMGLLGGLKEERVIVAAKELIQVLGINILGLYNANKLTEEYVTQAGHGFEWEMLKSLPFENSQKWVNAINENLGSEDILKSLGWEKVESINLFLNKIENESGDKKKAESLKKAYIKAVVEMSLAANDKGLKENIKESGFNNPQLAVILGQLKFEQKIDKTEGFSAVQVCDEFDSEEQAKGANEYTYQIDLQNKAAFALSVLSKPKDKDEAAALIRKNAEPLQKMNAKQKAEMFNEKSINAVLEAA